MPHPTNGHIPKRGRRLGLAALLAVLLAGWLPGAARSAGTDDYRLSVGDAVSFDFLDDALPPEALTVAGDGSINVPLVGGFRVAGLTVGEALAAVRQAFVDKRLFIDPQVSLAVTSFRPIFVLGDVKAPGSFAYQPTLTVEQAVALAGGQANGGATTEDRVVARVRLRGELDQSAVEAAKESVAAARVTAQLDGRQEILDKDLPPKTRDLVSSALLAAFMPTEQRILQVEQRGFETRRDQLTSAVGEVNGALANLAQLVEQQKAGIASARADYDRARELQKRGIKTLTDLAAVEREVTSQEGHLLEIYNQMSTTRRELGELQRQLADITDTRTRLALNELQEHQAAIESLVTKRQATEEQIMLLTSLTAAEAQQAATIAFSYQLRRRTDGRVETWPATLDDAVSPGDTVLVSIERTGDVQRTALASTAGLEPDARGMPGAAR